MTTPHKLTNEQFFKLVEDRRNGMTFKALAVKYHVSTGTASDLYHGKCITYPPVPPLESAGVSPEPPFVPDYKPPPPARRELLAAKRLRDEIAAKRLGLAMPVFKRTIGQVWDALEDIERRALARRIA